MEPIRLPLFKIRASQCGKIMGGISKPTEKQLARLDELQNKPKARTVLQEQELQELIAKRDAKPQLQSGAITYLQGWAKEQQMVYNRKKELSTKFTAKGILCEPVAIEFVAEQMGYGMVEKNSERKSDEWMEGEADLVLSGMVEDIKNSWEPGTFPLFAKELPESDYFYQLQVYMALWDKPRAAVNYCLIDAPDELIEQEAFRASRKAGLLEVDTELFIEIQNKMTFSDIPAKLKLKRFEFDRDDSVINTIRERVELCREHLKVIEQELNEQLGLV